MMRCASALNKDSAATAGPSLDSLQHLQLSHVKLVNTSSLLQLTHAPQLTSLIIEHLECARLACPASQRADTSNSAAGSSGSLSHAAATAQAVYPVAARHACQ